MKQTEYTHLKYIPKGTIYSIVSKFKDDEFGNVIGYASKDGEVYFRLEDDFKKFEFINNDQVYKTIDNKEINVKFKLLGIWVDCKFINKDNKLYLNTIKS